MSQSRTRTLIYAFACISLVVVGGLMLLVKFVGSSTGGTLASGRTVTTTADSFSVSSSFTADTATIEASGRKIVVQPTSLVVDGAVVAHIPEQVADVQVSIQSGAVTFLADGKPVRTTVR